MLLAGCKHGIVGYGLNCLKKKPIGRGGRIFTERFRSHRALGNQPFLRPFHNSCPCIDRPGEHNGSDRIHAPCGKHAAQFDTTDVDDFVVACRMCPIETIDRNLERGGGLGKTTSTFRISSWKKIWIPSLYSIHRFENCTP